MEYPRTERLFSMPTQRALNWRMQHSVHLLRKMPAKEASIFLPTKLWNKVFFYLDTEKDAKTIINLASTCRLFNKLLKRRARYSRLKILAITKPQPLEMDNWTRIRRGMEKARIRFDILAEVVRYIFTDQVLFEPWFSSTLRIFKWMMKKLRPKRISITPDRMKDTASWDYYPSPVLLEINGETTSQITGDNAQRRLLLREFRNSLQMMIRRCVEKPEDCEMWMMDIFPRQRFPVPLTTFRYSVNLRIRYNWYNPQFLENIFEMHCPKLETLKLVISPKPNGDKTRLVSYADLFLILDHFVQRPYSKVDKVYLDLWFPPDCTELVLQKAKASRNYPGVKTLKLTNWKYAVQLRFWFEMFPNLEELIIKDSFIGSPDFDPRRYTDPDLDLLCREQLHHSGIWREMPSLNSISVRWNNLEKKYRRWQHTTWSSIGKEVKDTDTHYFFIFVVIAILMPLEGFLRFRRYRRMSQAMGQKVGEKALKQLALKKIK